MIEGENRLLQAVLSRKQMWLRRNNHGKQSKVGVGGSFLFLAQLASISLLQSPGHCHYSCVSPPLGLIIILKLKVEKGKETLWDLWSGTDLATQSKGWGMGSSKKAGEARWGPPFSAIPPSHVGLEGLWDFIIHATALCCPMVLGIWSTASYMLGFITQS